MAVKFKFSDHALERFQERFSHLGSPKSLVESAIPFGGQKGSEYLLLNQEHEIVFPIVCGREELEHTVKTVLTLQQAKANLSVRHGINFQEDIADKVNSIREKAEKERKALAQIKENQINENDTRISQENIKKLKVLAIKHVKTYGCFPTGTERKKVFKEIKEILPVSNANLNEYFLGEVGRLIRKRLKEKGF